MVVRASAGWLALLMSTVSVSGLGATPSALPSAAAIPEKPATTTKPPLKVNVSSAAPAPMPSAPEAASSAAPQAPPLEPAPPDPLLVKKAIDVSAEEPADGRTRLGLRLAVVARGPAEPWLLAVVNRGTEPAHVLFDLRLLSLEISPPPSQQPEK